jgi:predicted ATPase
VKLQKLHIRNFKSLVDVEINEPNPFTVFVGPNGSGKSNIFEALEFSSYCQRWSNMEAVKLFGEKDMLNFKYQEKNEKQLNAPFPNRQENFPIFEKLETYDIGIFMQTSLQHFTIAIAWGSIHLIAHPNKHISSESEAEFKFLFENLKRIFIGNDKLRKQNIFTDASLNIDASNLENVLKRVLENKNAKEEITEHLQIFIPEFEKIEIQTSTLSGKNDLAIYEKTLSNPLTKNLISDGTYNILSLLTALYQTDEPQFLCIEEPENGLHPFAIKQLVKLFRQQCKEKGHYIWLNTHSQTLVSELTPEEIITVNKENGATKIKQHQGENIYSLTMDEAWLSNALGGGVPW